MVILVLLLLVGKEVQVRQLAVVLRCQPTVAGVVDEPLGIMEQEVEVEVLQRLVQLLMSVLLAMVALLLFRVLRRAIPLEAVAERAV
jgi:hypothetical protein